MDIQKVPPSHDANASFLRFVYRFTFGAAIASGTLLGLILFLLRWNGLLDRSDYSYSRIIRQSTLIGLVFPALLCTMFWVLSREGSTKWVERLGFVLLFVLFPIMFIVALIRFFSD